MRTIPADLRLYYLQRPSPLPGWQTYFPSLELLFPSLADQTTGSPCLAASELVVSMDTETRTAVVEHLLKKQTRTVPIWTRQMHLLEPLDVMAKEYVMPRDGALPTFREAWQRALVKINDPFNEAYTDAVIACMVSRLVETGKSPHFCRFFGTFNGRAPTYSYNITDDMEDIEHEDWFREGLAAGAFKIMAVDPMDPTVTAELTQPWTTRRRPLAVAEGDESVGVSDCDLDLEDEVVSEHSGLTASSALNDSQEGIEEIEDIAASGEAAVLRRPQNRLRLSKASSSSGESSSLEDEEEDELEYKVVLQDYPVQMTVLERCDGTMDDLMEDEIADDATPDMRETKEARWTAWIFQVIAALTAAQHYYDFIHNDLHTNNVMWCGTGETHLYYHVTGAAGGDRYYRVPTYGRLFKIIDFGRATFRPSAASKKDNHVWFPDAYAPDADATGQYNCGPYFEQGKPKVLPNKSFDLCRLAAAILDTLWNPDECPEAVQPRRVLTREPGRVQPETVSPLWNLLWLWLTDRHGKNLLRTPNDHERFPGFDLYCAIARDAVNAVPAQQLTLPLFDSAYRCRRRDIPADAPIYKLQAVHRPA